MGGVHGDGASMRAEIKPPWGAQIKKQVSPTFTGAILESWV
jgi:hypothetical protein